MATSRLTRTMLTASTLVLAATSPSWAAGNDPGALQKWLVEHRPTLWTLFFAQLIVMAALSAWEIAFQMQARKASTALRTATQVEAEEPPSEPDPFKAHLMSQRPQATPVPPPSPRRSDAAPPVASPVVPPRPSSPDPDAGSAEETSIRSDVPPPARRPSAAPMPLERPAAAVPPPASPSASSPSEAGSDSWADALRRTAQESPARPQRRGVPMPPLAGARSAVPAEAASPPAGAPSERADSETAARGGDAAWSAAVPAPPPLPREITLAPVAPGRDAATPPPSPARASTDAVGLPDGCDRASWEQALHLLRAASLAPCALTGVTAHGPSEALVEPPRATAQMRRGRGMKLAAGGGGRAPDSDKSDSPAAAQGVPGFTGVVRRDPAAAPPASRPPEAAREALPWDDAPPRPTSGGSGERARPGLGSGEHPTAPLGSGEHASPPGGGGTPRRGIPLASPGAPRRALDLPTSGRPAGRPAGDAAPPPEGVLDATAAKNAATPVEPKSDSAAEPSLRKENTLPLRNSQGPPRILEIPKSARGRDDAGAVDPNDS